MRVAGLPTRLAVTIALGVLAAAGLGASTADRQTPGQPGDRSVSIPAADLVFYRTKDGLTFANGWGDPATGPHSNFIRLGADSASPPHTHTASYYGVVIDGTISNERPAQPDRPLGPGSYWYQKGSEVHVTKCFSARYCLIFVTSKAPFDFHVAP
jgi:hypothetical protein